jgi:hypothetical protein
VVHTCDPSYSVGRDQEDLGWKLVHAKSLRDLISKKKNPSQEKAGGVAQGVGSGFKHQPVPKKKKKKKPQ